MEAFVEVIKSGSFSGAAKQLQVSTSHISRLVNQLETELGTTLIYRTTRKIRLSEAGEFFYQHCKHLPAALQSAEDALLSLNKTLAGSLRITCANTFGERFIAPLMNDLLIKHPKLELDLHLTNREIDLIEEDYDLAIRMGVLKDSSYLARRLCDRKEHLIASAQYIEQFGQPHTLNELSHHNCLMGSKSQWVFQENGQRREIKIHHKWRSNSGTALLDAVKKGLGIAQLPDYYLQQALKQGDIVSLLPQYQYPYSGVWLIYPKVQQPSQKLKAVCDYLIQAFEHSNLLDPDL